MSNWIVWCLLAGLVFFGISFLRVLSLRSARRHARVALEMVLRQRYEVAVRLASAAPGWEAHAKDLQRRATSAQAAALSKDGVDRESLEAAFTSALDDLLEAGGAGLTDDPKFMALHAEAEQVTEALVARIKRYNDLTAFHNLCITEFPALIFAAMLGAVEEPYFLQDEELRRRNITA